MVLSYPKSFSNILIYSCGETSSNCLKTLLKLVWLLNPAWLYMYFIVYKVCSLFLKLFFTSSIRYLLVKELKFFFQILFNANEIYLVLEFSSLVRSIKLKLGFFQGLFSL